jgi:homoserine kinase
MPADRSEDVAYQMQGVIMVRPDTVEVRVPATSADLGPGLDVVALALDVHDRVSARATESGVVLRVSGQTPGSPADRPPVLAAMDAAFDRLGRRPPGVQVRHHREIPAATGMGSTAAAAIAGICAARALVDGGDDLLGDQEVIALAAHLTGRPNGVAACLLGGLTLTWSEAGAVIRTTRLRPHPDLCATIFEPEGAARPARRRPPKRVPMEDAFANAGRSSLLVVALTRSPDLLLPATEDFLRRSHHAAVQPDSAALVARLRSAGVPAMISGTGPGVLALTTRHRASGLSPVPGWRARPVPVDTTGAVITRTAVGRRT